MIEIKFKKLNPLAILPSYQTEGASGFDFHSVENIELRNGEVKLVATGLAVEIPRGYELQVRARSGLAAKHGIFLVNGIGTIDADYRGEIKIILSTCGKDPVQLKIGDRVAQGVLIKVEKANLEEVTELSDTQRGAGGFGHTGIAAN